MSFLQLMDFNGSVKRNKYQDAMLRTLNSREEFLQRLEDERRCRTQDLLRTSSALKIQKCWRRRVAQKLLWTRARKAFDDAGEPSTIEGLAVQITRLSLFYKSPDDDPRIIFICGRLLAHLRASGPDTIPKATRKQLLRCVLTFLKKADQNCNVAVPLRTVGGLLDSQTYEDYVKNGFFSAMLRQISFFSPSSITSVHWDERRPPKLETLCEFLMIPFDKAPKVDRASVLCSLLHECSTTPHLPACLAVVLPYISSKVKSGEINESTVIGAAQLLLVHASEANPKWTKHLYAIMACVKGIKLGALPPPWRDQLILALSGFAQSCNFDSEVRSGASVVKRGEEMETDQQSEEQLTKMMENFVRDSLASNEWLSVYLSTVKEDESTYENRLAVVHIVTSIHKPTVVESLSGSREFAVRLWKLITSLNGKLVFGVSKTYVSALCKGEALNPTARLHMMASLCLFSSLLSANIRSIDDTELVDENPRMLFTVQQLTEVARVLRDITLGLIDLAFPEGVHVKNAQKDVKKQLENAQYSQLFEAMVGVVRTIQQKDQRVRFLPAEFWSDHGRQVVLRRSNFGHVSQPYRSARRGRVRMAGRHGEPQAQDYASFTFVQHLVNRAEASSSSDDESDDGDATSSTQMNSTDMRNVSIMRSIPFVVSFRDRNKMFEVMLKQDREHHGISDEWGWGLPRSQSISISVRRQHLYEDAFEALSISQAPDLRFPMRVHMINWVGLNEEGVDGGGIFREFLSELIKTAFDPTRGFFQCTHDRLLYPNPLAAKLYPDNYSQHFFFLGRMIAKLIYERQLAEIRFAEFFVAQLLGAGRASNVDLHHMKSYDPILWHQLVKLRDATDEELKQLDLDFTIQVEELGSVRCVELVPNGRNIPVTTSNKQQYVQLYVNYHLYKRMEPMVDAMRAGVADVIDVQMLAIFCPHELQLVVSGTDSDLNIEDMKKHCAVHNIQNASDQRYVDEFWYHIDQMTSNDKRALLKFITGCSRPPLEGFKDLHPAMGIQLVHTDNGLPTSATCMNLFKLPVYENSQIMMEKIRYAINAGAGFELA